MLITNFLSLVSHSLCLLCSHREESMKIQGKEAVSVVKFMLCIKCYCCEFQSNSQEAQALGLCLFH